MPNITLKRAVTIREIPNCVKEVKRSIALPFYCGDGERTVDPNNPIACEGCQFSKLKHERLG